MTEKDGERGLARALEQMRKEGEASAPSFHATLSRARAGRSSRRPAIAPALAAAAVLAFIAGLLAVVSRKTPASQRPVSAPPSAEASLERWESPTDFLLDTPGSEIWRGLPRLTDPHPSSPPADSASSKKGAPS